MPSSALVAAVLALALAGCTETGDPPPSFGWTEHALPDPAGAAGRTVVRDAVECGEGWWVVGAVLLDRPSETRDTRPAAWFSRDDSLLCASKDD